MPVLNQDPVKLYKFIQLSILFCSHGTVCTA